MRDRRKHPLIRLTGTIARLPRYLNLAQGLARDSRVPALRKAALVGGIGYALSPVDLIPGIVPVVGQLDDLAALLLGIRLVLNGCPPEVVEEHLARSGLAATALDADLATARDAGKWLVGGTLSLGLRTARTPVRLLRRGRTARRRVEPAP